jgi:hypothetical protein
MLIEFEYQGDFNCRTAHACPVHKSLQPHVRTPIEFSWERVRQRLDEDKDVLELHRKYDR